MDAVLVDLERSGPEELGSPLKAVALLAVDVGELHAHGEDALSRRRRRAAAARCVRRALSLSAAISAALGGDRRRAFGQSAAALQAQAPTKAGVEPALGHVARLVLLLPAAAQEEGWEQALLAFPDDGVLDELRDACVALAATALAQL